MKRQAAQKLISTVDRRLYELNNKLSLYEYAQDRGDAVEKDIAAIKRDIAALLSQSELGEAVECWLGDNAQQENPLLARKALLLARMQKFSAIEHNEQLLRAGQDVRKHIIGAEKEMSRIISALNSPDRSERQKALATMAQTVVSLEPVCRRWALLANDIANQHGYAHYADACLANEDLTQSELTDLFTSWKDHRREQFRSLADIHGPEDLVYLATTYKARLDKVFARKNAEAALRETLPLLGLSSDRLPVTIEKADIGFTGACYRIDPPKNIRIVVNANLTGFSEHFFLLHEFGHAMYYCYCPTNSELLIDCQAVRETLADMWSLLVRDPLFLQRIMGADDKEIPALNQAMSAYFTLRLFLFIRDTMFTASILTDPAKPFAELWRAVNKEWLGIDDCSGAFDLYDFQHPLAMKNYVFAQVLSERAMQNAESLLSTQMVTRFATYCRPGNVVAWKTKFNLS